MLKNRSHFIILCLSHTSCCTYLTFIKCKNAYHYTYIALRTVPQLSSVQSLSCVWLWPHGLQHARLPCPSLIPWSLLKLISIESVMPSNHSIPCCSLLLLLPSIFPSIRVFSNELVLQIRWPKYWSFSFSIRNKEEQIIGSNLDRLWDNSRINWLEL